MFYLKFILLFLFSIIFELNSQSFLSKVWHNSTSRFNYYYNANLIVNNAKEDAALAYKDNFKQILELYDIPEASSLKGNAAKMEEALKKCSHIIEKHSKGKWVDDSYLLMGDANFFKGEYYSAIEIYEYVAGTYKNTIPAAKAELNLLKTYIQLKKYDDAQSLYSKLSSKKDFPKTLINELNIAGAAINIKQGKYPVAIKLLETTIPHIKIKKDKVRYNFVLAQLYALNKNYNESNLRYKKVIKLNPNYDFAFNAKLNMAKAINVKNKAEVKQAIATLNSMLKDDKNIDYYDQIYFELGNLDMSLKNESGAIANYRKALNSKSNDYGIKTNCYMALADLYFKKQDYENAQMFYDSAARTVDKNHPEYNSIIQKNLVLNDLIKHLVNIREKDSLMKLALNEKLREKTIDKLIEQEKLNAELQKQLEEKQKLQQQMMNQNNGSASVNTTFPFYNQAARTKGYQDFQRIWGNRVLQDNWAIKSNKTAEYKKQDQDQLIADYGNENKNKLINEASADRKKYYYSIPFSKTDQEAMKESIAESYYLGANVYYQGLKENEKAKKMLEFLLKQYPKSKYEENAWYLLAKIYKEENNTEKYNYYLDLLTKSNPNSSFIKVLNQITDDSSSIASKADNKVEELYQECYNFYKAKKYTEALAKKSENDSKFPGNPLQVNFDYIETLIYAAQGNNKLFEEKLKGVAENYPQTEIGKQATQTLAIIESKKTKDKPTEIKTEKYNLDNASNHFFLMVLPKGYNMNEFKVWFSQLIRTNYPSDNLQITNSLLNPETQILIINNFKDYQACIKFIQDLKANTKFLVENKLKEMPQTMIINQSNFSTLMSEKTIDEYYQFYLKNYSN